MATELAKAYVGIIPSAEGITGNLAKVLEPEAESAGEKSGASLGGLLVSTLKGVLATAALGKALTDTLTEGGALEQSLGGVETLFKDNADTVKAYAQNAWQAAGLSANDYMEIVTGFSASLLQGLGGDTATAAEVANMALTDMSDNANKMGTNMQDIQNAYQGFAKQNYTMLDNLKLGYGGTKTEMQRLLADAQKITGVKYDLDNLADVYTAIHVIQGGVDELNGGLGDVNKGLGITGTTALEASTTLAGSLAAMQASFKNVLGALTLGQDLQPSLDALAQSVVTFLTGNLLPDIWNILSALPGALVTFIQALAQTLLDGFGTSFSGGFPQIIENGAALVSNLVQGITANAGQMMESASVSLNAFLAQVVADLPQIITSGGQMLLSLVQGLLAMLPSIIRSAATVIATLLQAIVTHLPEIIAAGFNLVINLVQGIGNASPDIIRAAGDACRTLWDAVKNVDWVQLGKDIINGLINGIGAMGSALKDAARSIASSALDTIKDFFGIASPSRVMRDEVGRYIPAGLALGIRQNAGDVAQAMDELSDLSTGSLQSNVRLALTASGSVASTPSGREIVDFTPVLAVLNNILAELHNSSGDIVIGDDVIYRSFNRARQSQSIMLGGCLLMLKRTSLLQIDSHSLPVPTGSPTIKFSDVESSDSGADEMGVYHREVLRFGVLTCTLTYSYLDNADCAYLLGLLQNKTTFQFTCPIPGDAADVAQTTTRTCYCSNYGAALQRLKAGVWRDMDLKIKEC